MDRAARLGLNGGVRAVGSRVRAALRRRWAAALVVAVIVGLVSGAVLTLAAGARRTGAAPDAFTAAIGGDVDAAVQQASGRPRTAEVAAVPGVASVDAMTFAFAGVVDPKRGPAEDAIAFIGNRPLSSRLVAGRATNPDRPHEFVADRSFARAHDAHVGDKFQRDQLDPGPRRPRPRFRTRPEGAIVHGHARRHRPDTEHRRIQPRRVLDGIAPRRRRPRRDADVGAARSRRDACAVPRRPRPPARRPRAQRRPRSGRRHGAAQRRRGAGPGRLDHGAGRRDRGARGARAAPEPSRSGGRDRTPTACRARLLEPPARGRNRPARGRAGRRRRRARRGGGGARVECVPDRVRARDRAASRHPRRRRCVDHRRDPSRAGAAGVGRRSRSRPPAGRGHDMSDRIRARPSRAVHPLRPRRPARISR